MAKTMTFEEILSQNPNLYETTEMRNDEATQAIIYDWFRFRRVTSNKRFPLYFQRVISRDYSRYLQLLRIEAGKIGDSGRPTNYDWLINEYLEELKSNEGEKSTSSEGSDSTIKGVNFTETERHSGADVNSGSASYSSHDEYTSDTDISGDDDTTSNEHNNTGNTTESRAGALAKSNPMSAEYTNNDYENLRHGFAQASNQRATSGFMNTTDSGYPSNPSSIAGINKDFPNLKIKNPSSASDSFTTAGAVTEADNHAYVKNDYSSHTDNTGKSDSSGSSSNSNTLTHGHIITREHRGDAENKESTITNEGSESHSDTDTLVRTGRHGDISKMLTDVITFINKSSACDWYRTKLETCFMQCIDEEED